MVPDLASRLVAQHARVQEGFFVVLRVDPIGSDDVAIGLHAEQPIRRQTHATTLRIHLRKRGIKRRKLQKGWLALLPLFLRARRKSGAAQNLVRTDQSRDDDVSRPAAGLPRLLGEYISIQRPDKQPPFGEDLIVGKVWWRLGHPETGTIAPGEPKLGSVDEIVRRMRRCDEPLFKQAMASIGEWRARARPRRARIEGRAFHARGAQRVRAKCGSRVEEQSRSELCRLAPVEP